MATSNEKEFKVGDTVWDCTRVGKGKVCKITNDRFGVHVIFEDSSQESYDENGYFDYGFQLPSLYHQPYTITLQEIPEELPEVGTIIHVWDDDSIQCCVGFFIGKEEGRYLATQYYPSTSEPYRWDNMSLTLPDKFK